MFFPLPSYISKSRQIMYFLTSVLIYRGIQRDLPTRKASESGAIRKLKNKQIISDIETRAEQPHQYYTSRLHLDAEKKKYPSASLSTVKVS